MNGHRRRDGMGRRDSGSAGVITAQACATCGHQPASRVEAMQQVEDLEIVWLEQDARQGRVCQRQHCFYCQPHDDCTIVECVRCGDGPIITGRLGRTFPSQLPDALTAWFTDRGWEFQPELVCPGHQQ
jgi:Zn ribbon nucleic-acid-binding protein